MAQNLLGRPPPSATRLPCKTLSIFRDCQALAGFIGLPGMYIDLHSNKGGKRHDENWVIMRGIMLRSMMNDNKHALLPRGFPSGSLWHVPPAFMKILSFFALILIALSSQAAPLHQFIAIGTGNSAGVYFQTGNAICRMLNKDEDRNHNIRCIPAATKGSVDNIQKLDSGKLDFGIVQSDVQHQGYSGEGIFAGDGFKTLRSVLSLYAEPFHLIVRQDAGISSLNDLKGKRVNVGAPGSGTRSTFDKLMQAHHVDMSFFGQHTELTSNEQTNALCKGRIDAFASTAGVPSASVVQAINECGASIISLETLKVFELISNHPYYDYMTISAKSYERMQDDVYTLGAIATLVTTAEMDENIVYEVVQAVFENIDHLREFHPAFADLNPLDMACRGLAAPLHDGAKRYFAEHGLDICP